MNAVESSYDVSIPYESADGKSKAIQRFRVVHSVGPDAAVATALEVSAARDALGRQRVVSGARALAVSSAVAPSPSKTAVSPDED